MNSLLHFTAVLSLGNFYERITFTILESNERNEFQKLKQKSEERWGRIGKKRTDGLSRKDSSLEQSETESSEDSDGHQTSNLKSLWS